MKKILMACAVVALTLGAVSCNKGNAVSDEDKALSDSLSTLGGYAMGSQIGQQWAQFVNQQPDSIRAKYDKDAFMRGFAAAMKTDTTNESYVMGFNMGLNAWQFAMRQNSSVKVDVNKFVAEFKKAFMADSMTTEQVATANAAFQQIMNEIQEAQMKKMEEAKANSPEAIANRNAGEAYVKQAKAADSSIQTTGSGLSYKIENAGAEQKIQRTDNVKIRYTGKLVDGTEFDKSPEEGITLQAGNFVPGFTEGLLLLGKGGKATLYIPGELAYGANGIPQAGIGPMSTLVFDVEVLDVTPAPAE